MACGPVLPAWFPGASSLWSRAPRLCPSQPAGFRAPGGGKPPFLPPFSSVLFPGSLSSWQQLAQWPCCRYWKLFASPVCSSLSASLSFPFLPRSLVVSLEQCSVRLVVWSLAGPSSHHIACVVSLLLSCHTVPVASACVLPRFCTRVCHSRSVWRCVVSDNKIVIYETG